MEQQYKALDALPPVLREAAYNLIQGKQASRWIVALHYGTIYNALEKENLMNPQLEYDMDFLVELTQDESFNY